MSDLLFSEDQHLFKSGPIRIAELHAVVDEMMERTGVLKEQILKDLNKCDDDSLLFIFTNQPLWLERVEHLDNCRYKVTSYLNNVKKKLSPEKSFQVMASINESKLVAKEVHYMLNNVEKLLKQRNVPFVPDYITALSGMINSIDKPSYDGGTLPHVHTFTMEVKKYFETIKIPLVLQGSFIRRHFLSGQALSAVESSLPIGKQASREDIFNILERNFGDYFLILKSLKKKHACIGPIPSFYSRDDHGPCDWKNIAASCQKHMQVLYSLDDLLFALGDHVLNIEYLTHLMHILPQQILFTVSVLLEEKTSLRSKLDVIKSEIIKLERVSTQCFVEEQALELTRNTITSISRDNPKTPTLPSNEKHQHGAFKLSTCRVCRLLVHGSNLTPTWHRVTKTGFLIKDECPHLSTLSHSERSGLLVRRKICRSCLSMRIDEAGHGPEGYCNYLEKKKLLHLKCKKNGCRLRKSLCDHSQSLIQAQQSNTEHSSYDAATTTILGDEKSNNIIRENNATNKGECNESSEKVIDYNLDKETNHYKEGIIASEMVAMIRKCIVDTKDGDKRETVAVRCDDRGPSAVHYDAESKSVTVNKHEEEKKNFETHVMLKTTTNMESENLNEKAIKTVGDNKPDSNRSASLLSIGEADGEINHSDHAVKGRVTRSGKMIRTRSLVVKREQHYGTSNSRIVISTNTLANNYQDNNSASGMREVEEPRLWTKIFKVVVYKGISILLDTGQCLF